MAKLYELGQAFNAVYEQLYDSELPVDEIIEAANAIEGMFEDKADSYAMILRSMDSDCDSIKAEEQRLAERRKSLENRRESFKKALEEQMIDTGKEKFKTALFSFGIQNNPASVNVVDETAIGNKYWVPQDPKLDKKQILADLKEGAEVAGAQLQQTRGLRIR